MAINQLKAGAVLAYATVALNNILGLVYTPYMLRMMGQSEYGLYSLANSMIVYLTIFDLGFGHTIVRYTAKLKAEGRTDDLYSMFGMFILIYSAIALLALGVGLILYFNIDTIFGNTLSVTELRTTNVIMLLMLFNMSFTFIFTVFTSIISAYEKFVFQRVVNIARILLNTAVMIVLLQFGYKAIGMVVVATICNVGTLLLNYWYCMHKINIKIYFRKFEWGFLKELVQYSFFIFLIMIMDRIYMFSGQFILGSLSGTVSVAIFALAMQFLNIYVSFSTSISSVFLPRVTSMISRDNSKEYVSDLFIRTGRIQFIIISFVLAGFILFGREFIRLWVGDEYSDVYGITLLLFVSMLVPLIQSLGNTILRARNQMKFQSVLSVVVAAVCLVLQIYLAKLYGGFGCALAIAITQVLGYILIMNIYYYKKQYIDIYAFWRNILGMFVPVCLLSGVSYFVLTTMKFDSIIELIGFMAVFSVLFIAVSWNMSLNQYERDLFGSPIKNIVSRLNRKK